MLTAFVAWLVVAVFLVVCVGALFILLGVVDANPTNGPVGRTISRKNRETEQWLYSEALPLLGWVVFGVPALFVLYLISKVVGVQATVIGTIVFVFLFALVVVVGFIYIAVKSMKEEYERTR